MTHRRIAAAVAAWACMAAHAASGEMRCDPAPRWEDFSSIAETLTSSGPDAMPSPVSFAVTLHDDGVRILSEGAAGKGPSRVEVVQLTQAPGDVAVGSDPSAALQLGEVGMVFELPLGAMRKQFEGPCGMHANVRYPVAIDLDGAAVTGQFRLDGDAISFALEAQRGAQHIAGTGKVVYARERGKLPGDLDIRGWTVFRGGAMPEHAEPSRFDTLAALRESLAASGAK